MKTRTHTPSHHAFFGAIRPLVLGTALLGSVLSLSGCFPLAAGGAIMTGFVAADRRSSGTQEPHWVPHLSVPCSDAKRWALSPW